MTFSADELRRQARMIQREHDESMPVVRHAVERLFDPDGGATAHDIERSLLGDLSRRRVVTIGGAAVLASAVLAACSSSSDDSAGPPTSAAGVAASTTVPGSGHDITVLNTAMSLEALAVLVYKKANDSGLVKTQAVSDATKLFQSQHADHQKLLQNAVISLGGKPFTTANPAILPQVQPAIEALRDEQGVLQLALKVEQLAAATYFNTVGSFTNSAFDKTAMSVGGIEARHAAVLSAALGLPPAPAAVATAAGAVSPGTGV